MPPRVDEIIEMYRLMVLTREYEEICCEVHAKTPLAEQPHASTGQEAIAVGTCFRLRKDDVIIPSLRTRGAFIVKGVPTKTLVAGAMGKAASPSGGRNTSHHMGDLSLGIICGSGVLGSHVPVAIGAAFAFKHQKRDSVAVSFFGDGAANRGDIPESWNLAALWKLPAIFICENNLYACSTPTTSHTAVENVADRARGYGVEALVLDGNDVLAIDEAMTRAVAKARTGGGPTVLECMTYRWRPHTERDPTDLRPKEELAAWKERDPIPRLRTLLLEECGVDEAILRTIEKAARDEILDAIRFAQESPWPPPEDCLTGLYAPTTEVAV